MSEETQAVEVISLEERIALLESVLEKAKILKRPGGDVRDGSFDEHGRVVIATFDYRCLCKRFHEAVLELSPFVKSGASHTITGPCGRTTTVRLYKS